MDFGEFMWYALASTLAISLIVIFGWMGVVANVIAFTAMTVGSRAVVCKCKMLGKVKHRFSLVECS